MLQQTVTGSVAASNNSNRSVSTDGKIKIFLDLNHLKNIPKNITLTQLTEFHVATATTCTSSAYKYSNAMLRCL